MTRSFALLAVVGLSLSTITAPVLADEPPLKGPEVKDRNVPGVDGRFGDGNLESNKRGFMDRLPPRVFREALDVVLSPNAPANLRVSNETRQKIEGMVSDYEQQVRTYMQDHRAELQELRKKSGDGERSKRPGQPPAGGGKPEGGPAGGGPGGESPAAREEFRKIMAGAPKIEDVQTKIWAELTPEQQKAVDAKLQVFRDKASEMRQDQYVKQKLGKKAAGAAKAEADARAAARPEGRPGPGGDRISPERRERIMQLLSRLTPEQQDELIQRLEARAAGAGQSETPGQSSKKRPLRPRGKQAGEDTATPKTTDTDTMQPQNP